jgi:uncharacterized membrane protein YsdA (DUF1294 family)
MPAINPVAFVVGAGFAAAMLGLGHWGLQHPRLVIQAPWTYVYGVVWNLVGMAIYGAWVHDFNIPFVVIFGVFAVSGLADFAAYWIDGGAAGAEARRQREIDEAVSAAVCEVRRQYAER